MISSSGSAQKAKKNATKTTNEPQTRYGSVILAFSSSSVSMWGWPLAASIGGVIVLVGLWMEKGVEKDSKNIGVFKRRKWMAKWGWRVLMFGIAAEVVLGFALACKDEIEEVKNDPLKRPITSISAIATFRIKGDFSPPPLPYKDLGEMSGASIIFIQGTNASDKIPSIGLGADAANISILNLIPNNVHPDTHDVVISFHDSGDVMYGHFFNKWMWQNQVGFFDHVKGLMIEMRQIGSNVNVLSGNVVVIANDLKWEFPIPAQKQRLGVISCKIIKTANGQTNAEIMPLDLMDFTGRPLGHFDGK